MVVLAGYAPSLLNFRGPLLAAIRAQGHQVIALAPTHDSLLSEDTANISTQLAEMGVHFQGIPMARTGLNPRQDLQTFWHLTQLFKTIRPDVVLSYTIKPVIYGSLAAKVAGVPRINALVTGLGYALVNPVGNWRRQALNLVARRLYAQAFQVCETVIFQNPDDQNQLVKLGLVARSHTAVVNGSGIDLDRFTHQPLPKRPVFLLVARLLRAKGIEEYVQAAVLVKQRTSEARFLLVGPKDLSPDAFNDEDIQRWQTCGVEYLGEVRDVRTVLRQASVYVLPSYREGTPRTVLEAMAMGRPVITTDAPGCRETVVEGQTGYLVPVGDVRTLADRMLSFIENPESRGSFGAAGRLLAEEKYDVHSVNRAMLQIMKLEDPRRELSATTEKFWIRVWKRLAKRGVDLILSALGLMVLALPMMAMALLIRIVTRRPALFQQVRPGLEGRLFTMYKFRTMTDSTDAQGQLLPDADRLTRLGRFLRSTSLDELPELLNVLKGDMSLVGPRPLLSEYLPRYSLRQARRHEVRPGITGWAQINGRNALSWEQKFEYDVWYVDHASFSLDLRILLATIHKVVRREDISAQGEATMSVFQGSHEAGQ
ncbi:sugar transferase (plasmid) [Deinococcus radiomollis]|uniref:sugar transferase n=1 Tax=Deinococcus radiomollis TaxID=468916 RepID=UPI00389261B2